MRAWDGGRPAGCRRQCDTGFTLVELLIVLVVLPIVVGAIAYALVATFSLQSGATHRLTNTDDAQVVASTFEKDVQSAALLTVENGSQYQCGSGGTQLLGLQWTSTSGMVVVSYEEAGSTSPYSLVRNYCTGGVSTPADTSTLVFNLPANQPPPTYNCSGSCAAGSGWISAAGVSDVTLAISETNSDTKTGAFTYSLVATPRIYLNEPNGPNGGGSPIYPLALLGQPSCASNPPPTLDMTGASTVTVKDSSGNPLPIYVASSCAQAITMIPGQTLTGQVSSIITNDMNTSTPGQDSYCVLNNKNQAGCNANQPGPPESAPTSSVIDPLASLTPPPNPSLPPSCLNHACAQGEEFSTAQNLTTNFGTSGDTYIFDQNVTISSNVTVAFAPGTYWFKSGLSMAQSTVSFGTGTYLFGNAASDTCPSSTCLTKTNGGTVTTDNTNGVLFYVETGAVTFNGSSQVSVSAAQSGYPLNTLYGEVALWDASTSPLSITNGSSATDTFSGIYDPNGEVILSGSGALTMAFIEANMASLTGSGALTLGQ